MIQLVESDTRGWASNFSVVENVTAASCGHVPKLENPNFVVDKVMSYLENLRSKGILMAWLC